MLAIYNKNKTERNERRAKVKRNQEQYVRQFKNILIMGIVLTIISFTMIMASEIDPNCVTPTDEQYLELRAVTAKEVEGQNKQVVMELWGNNVEFKRI